MANYDHITVSCNKEEVLISIAEQFNLKRTKKLMEGVKSDKKIQINMKKGITHFEVLELSKKYPKDIIKTTQHFNHDGLSNIYEVEYKAGKFKITSIITESYRLLDLIVCNFKEH